MDYTVVGILALCFSLADNVRGQVLDFNKRWNEYKAHHGKAFRSSLLEELRRRNWEKNLLIIQEHNAEAARGLHSYTLIDNHIADLNPRQYFKDMVRLTKSRRRRMEKDRVEAFNPMEYKDIPEELNWVMKGYKTPVWNQGKCGSCYAFSIAGSVEGQYFKNTGKYLELSKQQIVDCSATTGNFGCAGGSLRNTLRYLTKAGGLMSDKQYPYTGMQGDCEFDKRLSAINVTSWSILPPQDEKALQIAVAKYGPIAASLNAKPRTFQLYHSGIYDDEGCTSDIVNHAVLVVGYTKDAWILKNWWSKKWGNGGYMLLARDKNLCGIANYAAYPIIKKQSVRQ